MAPKSAKGKASARRASTSKVEPANSTPSPSSKGTKLPELVPREADERSASRPPSRAASPAPPDPSETAEAAEKRKKAKAKSNQLVEPASEGKMERPPSRSEHPHHSHTKAHNITQETLDHQQEKIKQLQAEKVSSAAELVKMDKEVLNLQTSLVKCEEGLLELTENNAHRQEEIAVNADQACLDARLAVDAANDRAHLAEDHLRELQRALWKAKARIHKAECILEQMEEDDLLEFLDPDVLEEQSNEDAQSDNAENPQEPQACLDQLISNLGADQEAQAPRPAVDPELEERVRVAEEKALEAEERARVAHEMAVELEAKLKSAQAVAEEAEHRHQTMAESAHNVSEAIAEEDYSDSGSGSSGDGDRRGSAQSEWHTTWSKASADEGEAVKKTKSIPAKLQKMLSAGFF